jgi:DNA (cytosine-5)-methyltransferase 1
VTRAYYNELDPYPAEWLRNLSAGGLIAPGYVDGRSIVEVKGADLDGYTQAHFFAGIGGWSYALRLAGWPDDVPVWTGSCPCQPFSNAGAKRGFADERHLWPEWFRLIRERRPPILFGEQVASPPGRSWFDVVSSELEALGYAVGAADLCAAGVGAPHARQRIFFVALGNADADRVRQHLGQLPSGQSQYVDGAKVGSDCSLSPSPTCWEPADWIDCRDGRRRPVEPGTFPLVDGVPDRLVRCEAYGNAISPQVAATFIRSAVEAIGMEGATCSI